MAKSFLPARAALTSVLLVLAGSAAASETRCVRGDAAIRRVEIAVQDPAQNVPCEVVYWKDTEQPGVRSVLWTAQTDAEFCARKAEELVATLESGGWECASADEPQSASRPAPPQQAARAPEQAAPPPAQQTAPSPSQQAAPSPPQQAAPSPPQQAAPPPSQQATAGPSQQTAPPSQPAAAPDAAASDAAPSRNGKAAPEVRAALAPQDRVTSEATEGAGGTALDTIIEQNLVRLNDGVDGRFAAEIAGYGDLDDDAVEDGVVFFTYESQRLGTARFIAAYLFDGENYALAATKPLAGSDDSVHSAELEAIENGVIAVRLNVLEAGDASCCPSGLRRESLVLRDGQLVEPSPAASAETRS